MFARQVRLARAVSDFLDLSDGYELLAQRPHSNGHVPKVRRSFQDTHIIVLFRAKDDKVNNGLVSKINSSRKIYVSGTKWNGNPACRIAVSTSRVDVERDLTLIRGVLEGALEG